MSFLFAYISISVLIIVFYRFRIRKKGDIPLLEFINHKVFYCCHDIDNHRIRKPTMKLGEATFIFFFWIPVTIIYIIVQTIRAIVRSIKWAFMKEF